MNIKDKQLIINRFNDRFSKYGLDIKALASGKYERRLIRYRVLSEIGIRSQTSVLDIGCGFADFYSYLNKQKIDVNYTGYDINKKFIDICKKKYPKAKFKIKDIQRNQIKEKFNFVVSSQTFNNKLIYDNNEQVVKDVIKRAFDLCSNGGGVTIDMLSTYVDFKEDHLYYYQPEKMFKFCKKLTRNIVLRHDYPLYEFTLYLYKNT